MVENIQFDNSNTYLFNQVQINSDVVHPFFCKEGGFSDIECDAIVALGRELKSIKGNIGDGTLSYDEVKQYRDVDNSKIKLSDDTRWIFDRIADVVLSANNDVYNYELTGMREGISFLHYELGGHFTWHRDVGQEHTSNRKLTAIVQLTDPTTYLGCQTEVEGSHDIPKSRGSITVFPAFLNHIAHEHAGGEPRNCLAVFCFGPPFK